jgi:hypothetical protein
MSQRLGKADSETSQKIEALQPKSRRWDEKPVDAWSSDPVD